MYIIHVFFIKKNFYTNINLKNPKTLKNMLRKSPASNAQAASFKNRDFS